MSRYIDAEALRKNVYDGQVFLAREVVHLIDKQPTAEVRENVKGEWVEAEICNGIQCNACSVCGYSPFYKGDPVLVARTYNFNYCPNCGADMRKGE